MDAMCWLSTRNTLEHGAGLLLEAEFFHATARPRQKYMVLLETSNSCLQLCRSGQDCEAFEVQNNVIYVHDWKAADSRCLDKPWVPSSILTAFSQTDQTQWLTAPWTPAGEHLDGAADRHGLDLEDGHEGKDEDTKVIHDDSAHSEELFPLPPAPDSSRGRPFARSFPAPTFREPRLGPLARLQSRCNETLAAAEARQKMFKVSYASTPSKSPSLALLKEKLAETKRRCHEAGEQYSEFELKKSSRRGPRSPLVRLAERNREATSRAALGSQRPSSLRPETTDGSRPPLARVADRIGRLETAPARRRHESRDSCDSDAQARSGHDRADRNHKEAKRRKM